MEGTRGELIAEKSLFGSLGKVKDMKEILRGLRDEEDKKQVYSESSDFHFKGKKTHFCYLNTSKRFINKNTKIRV